MTPHEDNLPDDELPAENPPADGPVPSDTTVPSDTPIEEAPEVETDEESAAPADSLAVETQDDHEQDDNGNGDDDDEHDPLRHTQMTFVEHLDELRKRIFLALIGQALAMIFTLSFGKWILGLLKQPYFAAMAGTGNDSTFLGIHASVGVLIYMKVAMISGLVLASPWICYQLWKFVGAGLYPRERKYITRTLPFSAALFITGAMFYLFVVAKFMLSFLIHFNDWLDIETKVTLENHINMMVTMMLVFGLGFQLPVAVAILGRVGLVTVQTLNTYRRYVIVALFIFAALATSPSPVDQVMLAIPMWGLYELGVMLVWMQEKKRRKEDDEEDDDDDDDDPDDGDRSDHQDDTDDDTSADDDADDHHEDEEDYDYDETYDHENADEYDETFWQEDEEYGVQWDADAPFRKTDSPASPEAETPEE